MWRVHVIVTVLFSLLLWGCGAKHVASDSVSSADEQTKPVSAFQSPLITRDRPYPELLAKQWASLEQTHSRLRMLTRSEKGRRLADECLSAVGTESKKRYQGKDYREALLDYVPVCAYYRMIFTGLYYKAKVVGYQKGLHSMIQDAQIVIESNPGYEDGGAYRVLSNIYMNVPSFSLGKDAILRDMNKAYDYAMIALSLAPDNPENLILAGRLTLEKGEKEAAAVYFKRVLFLLPRKGYPVKRERDFLKEAKGYIEKL